MACKSKKNCTNLNHGFSLEAVQVPSRLQVKPCSLAVRPRDVLYTSAVTVTLSKIVVWSIRERRLQKRPNAATCTRRKAACITKATRGCTPSLRLKSLLEAVHLDALSALVLVQNAMGL